MTSKDGPVCFVTDLPMAWCAHCRAEPKQRPKPHDTPDGIFEAQYHGTCAWCGGHISPGDRIAREERQPGGYIREECCIRDQ